MLEVYKGNPGSIKVDIPVEEFLPPSIRRADKADNGTFSSSIDTDRLLVPARFLGRESLTEHIISDLRDRTLAFYEQQYKRMEVQRVPETKRRSIQEVFNEQVEVFSDVTGGVETAFNENPALDLVILGWDADNTQGVVDEDATSAIVLPDELKSKSGELTQKERRLMEKIYVKDMYDRWIWNPAFLVAAKYLDDKYRDDPKRKVIQAVLTTKDQEGLDDNYADMLDEELPGIFDPRLIMSSNFNTRGSTAERLFHEITPALGERDWRGRPEKSLTVQQTLELIHASRQERAILMERILEAKDEELTEFDMKFLMMGRILDRSITEGIGGISPEPPPGVDPDEWHDKLFRERMFMLVEDNAHPTVLPHTQIGYIQIPRFRTPDSPDDVS